MKQTTALKIAKQSMRENRKVLNALGSEKAIQVRKNPDSELIDLLKGIMPKSTEGKIALIAAIGIIAWLALKK